MKRTCYISFKTEDIEYKKYISDYLNIDMIDKSLDVPINSNNPDYIMSKIRSDYLSDSTVTIHLIGSYSAENTYMEDQTYIKRELQASLYDGENNTRNGILGVVLPSMYESIYKGSYICNECKRDHNWVYINNNTTIREFNYNYYIPFTSESKCAWTEDDRFCVLTKWSDFIVEPEKFIEQAFQKRFSPISKKIKVYP